MVAQIFLPVWGHWVRTSGVIDLFSGCGGFGLGASLAGFHSSLAVDIDATLQSAYRLNFKNTKCVTGDVAELSKQDWKTLLDGTRPEGIIGGPPCQGFSRMGSRDKEDPRNSLVGHFYRTVSELRPRFFVMENVEGILDTGNAEVLYAAMEQVQNSYKIIGPLKVTASSFGAATTRTRVLVIGYLPDEQPELSLDTFTQLHCKTTTVGDAISDLPSPIKHKSKGQFEFSRYRIKEDHNLSDFAIWARSLPTNGLGDPDAVKYLAKGFVSGLEDTNHSKEVRDRFEKLKQGQTDRTSKAKRLELNGYCPTLRAGTGSDKGSHQAVRPIHPIEGRAITVREAARLQGFPDWFLFHPTKWHSFRMIGNSVSPLVAQQILRPFQVNLAHEEDSNRAELIERSTQLSEAVPVSISA